MNLYWPLYQFRLVSIPAGSKSGDIYCTQIELIDDFYVEKGEYFTVHLDVEDLNIKIPPNAFAWSTVKIKDDDGNCYFFLSCFYVNFT